MIKIPISALEIIFVHFVAKHFSMRYGPTQMNLKCLKFEVLKIKVFYQYIMTALKALSSRIILDQMLSWLCWVKYIDSDRGMQSAQILREAQSCSRQINLLMEIALSCVHTAMFTE